MREIGGPQFGVAQRMLEKAQNRFFAIEKKCTQQLLSATDVVVSTCIGSGGDLLREFSEEEGAKFSTVLFDEAAQCMESALLPALVLGAERLILIGDQNQLPPVVASPRALEHGLGVSLFARLAIGGIVPILLDEQYRMHPKIAEFPSRAFYAGKVKSKWIQPCVLFQRASTGPKRYPGMLYRCRFYKGQFEGINKGAGPDSMSESSGGFESVASARNAAVPRSDCLLFFNEAEANVVVSVIGKLLQPRGSLRRKDIGVVSPYSAQVRLLADRFKEEGWIDEDSMSNNLGEQYRDVSTGSGTGSSIFGGGSASGERSERPQVFQSRERSLSFLEFRGDVADTAMTPSPAEGRGRDKRGSDDDDIDDVGSDDAGHSTLSFTAEDQNDLGFLKELRGSLEKTHNARQQKEQGLYRREAL